MLEALEHTSVRETHKAYRTRCWWMQWNTRVAKRGAFDVIDVVMCWRLREDQSIWGVGQLTKFRTLDFSGIPELLGVENLTSLETLSVRSCKKLQWIQGLGAPEKASNTSGFGMSSITRATRCGICDVVGDAFNWRLSQSAVGVVEYSSSLESDWRKAYLF